MTRNLAPNGAAQPLTVDPAELMADPHAAFRALRGPHPLIRVGDDRLMLLRAQEVVPLFTDPDTKQVEGSAYAALNNLPDGPTKRFYSDVFLFSNGAAHRTARALFARSFSVGRIQARRKDICAVADRIARDLPRGEPFDFVAQMAARVPAEMIAELLGLDVADTPLFARLVYSLARGFTPIYPHALHDEIEAAVAELHDYVAGQLRRRLERSTGDLLSLTAALWAEDSPVPFTNLVHQVMTMIVAGVDTTRAAFAMMVSLLLQHPDQWRAVREDSGLIPGAVSEALRYEPSVASIIRVPVRPITLCGHAVAPGAFITVNMMAAMRDPQIYADPDRFDIERTDHPRLHMVFGHGPHRCLGEMLARIEMEEALAALIGNAPEVELLEAPRLVGFAGLRQITPMRVRID